MTKPKIIFVSVQSSGMWKLVRDEWVIDPSILSSVARLHHERPGDVFIVPSMQNYAILPYLQGFGPTYDTWKERCRRLIDVSDEVHVLTYPGWEDSVGVADEIAYATEIGVDVTYGK